MSAKCFCVDIIISLVLSLKLNYYMQYKLYLFFIGVCCLTVNCCFGQDFEFGIKGGASSRNLTNGQGLLHTFSPDNHLNVAPQGALFFNYKVSNTFSIQPQIEYSPQGSKKGIYVNTDPIDGAAYVNSAQLNYLMIPVLAKFGWFIPDSRVRVYIAAGPYMSFLTSARQYYRETEYDAGTDSFYLSGYYYQNIKPQLNSMNFGIEGNGGLAYYFANCSVFAEAGGNYGLGRAQQFASPGNKTGAVSLSLGMSFWFDKVDFRTDSHVRPLN